MNPSQIIQIIINLILIVMYIGIFITEKKWNFWKIISIFIIGILVMSIITITTQKACASGFRTYHPKSTKITIHFKIPKTTTNKIIKW